MTVRIPSQEWRLYMFGILLRLWKSNTAMSAITVRVKTEIIIVAWPIFNLNLDSTFRSMRYKRIPKIWIYIINQVIFWKWRFLNLNMDIIKAKFTCLLNWSIIITYPFISKLWKIIKKGQKFSKKRRKKGLVQKLTEMSRPLSHNGSIKEAGEFGLKFLPFP